MSSFVEMRTLLVYRDEPKDMSSGWVTVGPTRKGSVEGDFSLSVLWTSGSRLDDRLGEKKWRGVHVRVVGRHTSHFPGSVYCSRLLTWVSPPRDPGILPSCHPPRHFPPVTLRSSVHSSLWVRSPPPTWMDRHVCTTPQVSPESSPDDHHPHILREGEIRDGGSRNPLFDRRSSDLNSGRHRSCVVQEPVTYDLSKEIWIRDSEFLYNRVSAEWRRGTPTSPWVGDGRRCI